MSPTCSNRLLAGRNALSATDLTISLLRWRPSRRDTPNHAPLTDARTPYFIGALVATHNRARRRSFCERNAENRGWGTHGPWYVARALEESASITRLLRQRDRVGVGIAVTLVCLGLAACGGGGPRQDADEPEGKFPVSIVKAEFPNRQRLAETSDLTLAVRNEGDETIPDLAITINTRRQEDSTGNATTETTEEGTEATSTTAEPLASGAFSVISEQEGLAIPSRPVWILEQDYPKLAGETASAGADAAQTNTFSFGELDPGEKREMVWRLTPVQAGAYTIDYVVAAGLQGKAVAENTDGSIPSGEFVVVISSKPPQTRVDESGKVVPIKPSDIIGQAGSKEQKQELTP